MRCPWRRVEDAPLQRAGAQVDLGAVAVEYHDAGAGVRADLDHALHLGQAFSTLPALRHGAHPGAPGVGAVTYPDPLDVGQPAAVGPLVREADDVP